MEVVILRGKNKAVKNIADGLIAAKVVKHGKLDHLNAPLLKLTSSAVHPSSHLHMDVG